MTFGDNVNFTEVEVPDDDTSNESDCSQGDQNVFLKETRLAEAQITNLENELRKRSKSKRKRKEKEPERPYHRDKKKSRDEVNL